MPKRGAPLYSYLNRGPDSLEQADSFFSIAFAGNELKKGSIRFALLKNLIDLSYEAARRFLSPVYLSGAKSSTFDFPARALSGSLVLALDEPKINETRLRQRTSEAPVTIADAMAQFSRQREQFFSDIGHLIRRAEQGELTDAFAEENFSLLDNLQHIIPSDENKIARVEFAGKAHNSIRSAVVEGRAGTAMHRAFKRVERQVVTETGRIEIVNAPSKYFVYRSTRGKQVSYRFSSEVR